jgi:hypothetical protein
MVGWGGLDAPGLQTEGLIERGFRLPVPVGHIRVVSNVEHARRR